MSTPRIRSCTFCLELYPDNFSHQIARDSLDRHGFQYSGILHDKDVVLGEDKKPIEPITPVKPHWNIVLCFPRQRDLHVVARELDIEERWLEPARNRTAVERYHIHADNPEKFQYSSSEIFGPLAENVRAHLDSGKREDDKVYSLMLLLDTMPKPCTYRKFIIACCEAGLYGTLRRMGSLFKPCLDEHNGFSDGW